MTIKEKTKKEIDNMIMLVLKNGYQRGSNVLNGKIKRHNKMTKKLWENAHKKLHSLGVLNGYSIDVLWYDLPLDVWMATIFKHGKDGMPLPDYSPKDYNLGYDILEI